MIRNYLTIAWRHLLRQPGYTVLNLLGLCIGISSSLIIFLYLRHEQSYDDYHERAERIVRISSDIREPDDAFRWAVTQIPLGPALDETFPEVEKTVRFFPAGNTSISVGDKVFVEEEVYHVDSTIFQIFTYELIEGDPATAFRAPNQVTLSNSVATSMFGSASEAVGKTLTLNGDRDALVIAVYQDLPANSHILPRILVSVASLENLDQAGFGGFGIFTYALLAPGTSIPEFEAKLSTIIDAHVRPIFDRFNVRLSYEALPLRDIHLLSDFQGEPVPPGNMQYIWIFSAVAIFMLLIACINYMNLATARSARRAKEVGVRKSVGAWRSQLIAMFLTESSVLTLMALLLSTGLVILSLPAINALLGLQLSGNQLFTGEVVLLMLGILTLVGLISGSYPAFYLSGAEPAQVLKGGSAKLGGAATLRKGLVLVQFSISLVMLICTATVFGQLQFLREKDLGFTDSPVLRFSLNEGRVGEKWEVLAAALKEIPGVEATATGDASPGTGYPKNLTSIEDNLGSMVDRGLNLFRVDPDFLPTLEIQLVEGRNFDLTKSTDSSQAVIVNQALVRRMGWEQPIGKRVNVSFFTGDTLSPPARVIGVIQDYHHRSLYHEVEDLLLAPGRQLSIGHVRMEPGKVAEVMPAIEAAWKSVAPAIPFEPEFVEEEFQAQYEDDERRSSIFTMFSLLTIFIACLGLLGLASYATEQRTKEIGVRKVLGASTGQLVSLLTREFLVLVSLSALLAFPAAWLAMDKWLESFAYRISPSMFVFLAALGATLVITMATTSYHAIRTARANPIGALKTE